MTIRVKLLLLFLLFAVVPMIGVGVVSYVNSVSSVEAVVQRRSGLALETAVSDLNARIGSRHTEIRLLARNRTVRDFYESPESGRSGARLNDLGRFFNQFLQGPRSTIVRLSYTDATGKPLLLNSRSTARDAGLETFLLTRPQASVAILDPADHLEREVLFRAVEDSTHGLLARVSRPIHDEKGTTEIGFVAVDYPLDNLLRASSEQLKGRETLIAIDRRLELVIYDARGGRSGRSLKSGFPGLSAVQDEIATDTDGYRWYESGGERRLITFVNLDNPQWTLAVLSRPEPFIAPVRDAGLLNLLITAGAAVLVLILVPVVIGRITASIRKVSAGAQAIAEGDLDQTIDVETSDETRQLADSFNEMARSLKISMGALHTLTDELEDRVERRTADLEEANLRLEEVNVQLEEATRHKSDFLARMSHDLRTPMNAIIGYTRILLRRAKDALDERQYQNLENIQTSAVNLLELINSILDLSKIESGRIEINSQPVDMRELALECASTVSALLKPEVQLTTDLDSVGTVPTDPELMRRILMNLLGNAVKFTERGSIAVSLKRADRGFELAVADSGVGIPPEELPRVFDEFRQVEGGGVAPEGSGLGLAIVKRTVELLGGTIGVESEPGTGTTFTVHLTDGVEPQ